jgi:hypothetical protein
MSFKSFLSAVGNDAKAVFTWLGSSKGQTTITAVEAAAAGVTTEINPVAGAALVGIENLINLALKQVVSAETVAAAAAQQSGTGAQKSAAVIEAVSPQVSSVLTSLGVKQPAATEVQSISQTVATALATIVNAFPAPTA